MYQLLKSYQNSSQPRLGLGDGRLQVDPPARPHYAGDH
ncbi:Uncharacterised protein [Vibrio cholerae]|nr:Uncharacterised protein [Vibrio cholerae]